jgi:hypothetical protein
MNMIESVIIYHHAKGYRTDDAAGFDNKLACGIIYP